MVNWIIIVLALALSAFFSGMEIAFVASNKLRLEIETKKDGFNSKVPGIHRSTFPPCWLETIWLMSYTVFSWQKFWLRLWLRLEMECLFCFCKQ